MVRCLVPMLAVLVLGGCGPRGVEGAVPYAPCRECTDAVVFPDAGASAPQPDGGVDGGLLLACGGVPIGPDCCESGVRISSATCAAGAWTCTQGAFCTCDGAPQAFSCTDTCGSDAFLAPTCFNGQWRCVAPLVETSSCAPDTCWGEPGTCCGAPTCVDGGWVCGFKPAGC